MISTVIHNILVDRIVLLGFSLGFFVSNALMLWRTYQTGLEKIEKFKKIEKKIKKSTELKMVIVVRKDAKLTKKQAAVHCVRACIAAFRRSQLVNPRLVKQWSRWGQMKVAVKVNNEAELLALESEANKNNLVNFLARSDISKRNALALAIGPDSVEDINKVTGHLKLL